MPSAAREKRNAGRSAQPPRRSRGKQPVAAIDVNRGGGRHREASIADNLRQEARTGVPGLGVSVLLHGSILALMALIGVTHHRSDDPQLELGWISEAAAARTDEEQGRPLDIPINIPRTLPLTPEKKKASTNGKKSSNSPIRTVGVAPVDVKDIFNGRDRDKRGIMLEKYGSGQATERAVNTGLMWLKRQQRAAGNWQLHAGHPDAGYSTIRTDTGATSLALLAFLGTGHTHTLGDHQDTVGRGLKWLRDVQKPNGDFHDHRELGRQTAFYAHAQATIVLCEAFAMTGDESLRQPAQAGIAFLIDSQQPTGGGWKYVPQDEATVGDLSVTGWALMALHTARVAGFDVPASAFDLSARFLDTVQEQNGARYKYEPSDPAGRVTAALTAEGLLCRQFLGWPADFPALRQGVEFIARSANRPEWEPGRRNVYEWYYVGHVLHNVGGQEWKDWYQAAQRAIVDAQIRQGSTRKPRDVRGSWHPTQPPGSPHEYADKAGRLYITAMCILILELPYRHLPVYGE